MIPLSILASQILVIPDIITPYQQWQVVSGDNSFVDPGPPPMINVQADPGSSTTGRIRIPLQNTVVGERYDIKFDVTQNNGDSSIEVMNLDIISGGLLEVGSRVLTVQRSGSGTPTITYTTDSLLRVTNITGKKVTATPANDFWYDTFTESSDKLIQNHTPETGGTYSAFGNPSTVVAATGLLMNGTGTDSGGVNQAVPPSPNYTVSGVLGPPSGLPQLSARTNLTRTTGYFIFLRADSNGGTVLARLPYSPLAEVTPPGGYSAGDVFSLTVNGSTISVAKNGATYISVTDTTYPDAGYAAVGGGGGSWDWVKATAL